MSRPGPARPDEIRQHNLGRVLSQVHLHGELSRADLTQSLGLNRSTIRALVAELAELRFVREAVARTGMEGFNLVWRSEADFPTLEEIGEPSRWVERVAGA